VLCNSYIVEQEIIILMLR